ncbi:MAG: hypothetical protein IKZ53_07565 [Selenomonadaceae bacterium]|nr:hypothetical protein [Selenomonadaceae bacterium]
MTSAIRTNMNSVRAHNIFEANNAQATKSFNNVSTGLRINSVQDNPTNYVITEKMRERINSLGQAQQNIQNDTAMLKTADKGMSNIVDILRSLNARALEAADDSVQDNDRVNIAKEMTSLMEQINYTALSTKYNGKNLLATESGKADNATDIASAATDNVTLQFQVGDDTTAVIAGVTIQNMTLTALGLDTAYANVSAITDATTATPLKSASNNGTVSELQTALSTALDKALSGMANVGALEQRLGYTADDVSGQIENLEASVSNIADSDMAKDISDYMKWNVLGQAAQYMLAQSNQSAFQVLNLLQ